MSTDQKIHRLRVAERQRRAATRASDVVIQRELAGMGAKVQWRQPIFALVFDGGAEQILSEDVAFEQELVIASSIEYCNERVERQPGSFANLIWQCVPLHGHQESHLPRRQLVRAAIVGRDALFCLSSVRLLLLKQVEFVQAPVARLRALVGLVEVGGFMFAGKRERLFVGVLWGIGKNNPGLAVDHVANIGVQNELFNKFSYVPSSRFGGVGHVIPFQSFTGNLALVFRFTSRMKAPQPEIHGKSACCYISVRQHSPKYAQVMLFPASLTKLILGAFRGLIADVYRCTMYSIYWTSAVLCLSSQTCLR